MHVPVFVCVVGVEGPDEPPPAGPPPGHAPLVTDRLLAKIEKEQNNFDVQIGDGMDIGIIGENGEFFLLNK